MKNLIQLHYFFTLPDFMSFTTKKITCYDLKKSYHNFLTKFENSGHSVVMLLQGPIALRKQRLALFI